MRMRISVSYFEGIALVKHDSTVKVELSLAFSTMVVYREPHMTLSPMKLFLNYAFSIVS